MERQNRTHACSDAPIDAACQIHVCNCGYNNRTTSYMQTAMHRSIQQDGLQLRSEPRASSEFWFHSNKVLWGHSSFYPYIIYQWTQTIHTHATCTDWHMLLVYTHWHTLLYTYTTHAQIQAYTTSTHTVEYTHTTQTMLMTKMYTCIIPCSVLGWDVLSEELLSVASENCK